MDIKLFTEFLLKKGSIKKFSLPPFNTFLRKTIYFNDYGSMQCFFLAHLSTARSRGAFRVVRCPSCVVNNFFKHLLLPNRLANLDQTWQECSLGGPLQKLFTEFDSIKNSGCHGNEIEFLAHLSTTCSGSYCDRSSSGVRPSIFPSFNNFFKNLLLQNQKANLDKTWQECSLGEAQQKLLKEFNSNKNSGCHGNKMAENGKNL